MTSTDQPSPSGSRPAGQEPAIPFTVTTIDRAAELRHDPARVRALLSSVTPQVVCVTAEGVIVTDGEPPQLLRLTLEGEARRLVTDGEQPVLLGLEDGVPLLAIDLEGADPGGPGSRVITLRDAGTMLPEAEAGLAAYAVALLNWHRRHRFCANCGAPTQIAEAGLSRRCEACGRSHFPRTDPCVIMLVEHEGSVLLGRRTGWPEHRYSILAGFVAPGETPEEAVIREVFEESRIVAREPRYVASQPWPFPSSLMLGYTASADGGTPVPEEGEMHEVRWFTRDQVRAGQRGASELLLPGEVSIARILIDAWVAREDGPHGA